VKLQRTQVITSSGAFPVSITRHGNAVFVLNARNGGSIQGFVRVGDILLRVPSWHRELGLDPNATPEFTTTPGQVAFTPDGSKLLVTTKGNTSAVDVFSMTRSGHLSRTPVEDKLPGAVPFAMAFDPRAHLLLAEAGTNALATFAVRPDGSLRPIATAPTGQAATCWIVRVGRKVYLSNAGSANLSGYRLTFAARVAADLGRTATDPGTVDAAVSSDEHFLYVQTGAAGVVDEFAVAAGGKLQPLGSVTVPNAVGAEGIAAT
jgi:DNA-binding beta-propeller fold protein YncE